MSLGTTDKSLATLDSGGKSWPTLFGKTAPAPSPSISKLPRLTLLSGEKKKETKDKIGRGKRRLYVFLPQKKLQP